MDLSGLNVLTEAASGAYLFNPMIAILAGAKTVVTFCKDSQYGRVSEISDAVISEYEKIGISEKFIFTNELKPEFLRTADLITNSGHLRPFNAELINELKQTAVIPLMWETWEMRDGEIDLKVAKDKGILVLGTNEHEKPSDMRPYSFLTALHLMMSHEVGLLEEQVLIIGDQFILTNQ